MEQNKWELKSHSWQIADTGDYDGYWEITDGKTSICTKDDPDDERLEDVVKVLNSVQCNFYTNNDTELNQQLEIYQLKDEITILQARCDRYEKAFKEAYAPDFIDFVKDERNAFSNSMLSDGWWLGIPSGKRVVVENMLIAYDQMVDRLSKLSPSVANEALNGEGEKDCKPDGWPSICDVCGKQDCESDHK